MTAKNTSTTDNAQGALPFGAISDSGAAKSGSAKKKVARKKAAPKKEPAAKKAATKKAVTKKAATKKVATKKVLAKKAPPAKASTTKAEVPATNAEAPAAKKVTKKKVTKKTPARREKAESTPVPPAPAVEVAEPSASSNGAETSQRGASDGDSDRGDRQRDQERGQDGGGGEGQRRRTRRGRRRRRAGAGADEAAGGDEPRTEEPRTSSPERSGDSAPTQNAPAQEGEGSGRSRRRRRRRGRKNFDANGERIRDDRDDQNPDKESRSGSGSTDADRDRDRDRDREGRPGRSRKRGRGQKESQKQGQEEGQKEGQKQGQHQGDGQGGATDAPPKTGSGMFILDKGNVSVLRQKANGYLPAKDDVYVSKNLVQKYKLRDGMMISGPLGRGYKHKFQLDSVDEIDGQPPEYWKFKPRFQDLTSIDPDFHYAVGDVTDEVSMRVVDLISPIGRGQRGLLVAPPRTGKTTIMRQFAAGIEKGYPDVHLMVLLIDERPEEATEWRRSVDKGEVFVSTADESSKHHIQVAELVWKRAMRLVEMGEDVVLLLDSITRLARAYNNQAGPGRTMSGGLDSRAMERPRKIFGSARNTVEAGSLTILGTTLIETGSKLDQMVMEEFKGTGNMELVLNRKLSDRRIFPAIDIAKSGTRKEEKLVGMRRLKLIHVLRRVLARMHFAEAAELLISRLEDVEKTDDFLERFTVDPEA